MSDDEKTRPRHPETNFLPPLDMILTFFDKKKAFYFKDSFFLASR